MSHAHHFLSRLDRLSTPQIELALTLYRDHLLLQFILDKARVPEGSARVAISLNDPENGPFLVVTRDGKFVTCLGEGMSTGDLHVVSRKRLDDMASKYHVVQDRIAESAKRVGRHGSLGKLLVRIYESGHRLSREDFRAITIWQPMLGSEFVIWLVEVCEDLQKSTEILMRELRRTDKLDKAWDKVLQVHYEMQWALAHITALAFYEGPRVFESFKPEVVNAFQKYTASWPCIRQHIYGIGVRGIWAAARVGKLFLPHYKAQLTAKSLAGYGNCSAGIATIGMRHRRLRAEVRKALAVEQASAPERRQVLRRMAIDVMDKYEENPEMALDEPARRGAEEAVRLALLAPAGSPYRFQRPEDVPRDLALSIYANRLVDFLRHPEGMGLLYDILPWLATIDAEDLYLPADYLSAVRVSWSTSQSNAILVVERDLISLTKPMAHVKEGPARNGPCPCGSGKKYKRCCVDKTAPKG